MQTAKVSPAAQESMAHENVAEVKQESEHHTHDKERRKPKHEGAEWISGFKHDIAKEKDTETKVTEEKDDEKPEWSTANLLDEIKLVVRLICVGVEGERPWFNLCAVFIPLCVLSEYLHWGHSPTFIFSLLAMLPLAERLGFCTEELSEHVNDTVAGLMNASMGNAPELIISLFALADGKISLVKQSLIGSILSNILFVMGCALLAGGVYKHVQSFNNVLSSQNAVILLLCMMTCFLPTVMTSTGVGFKAESSLLTARILSLLLLSMYISYLVFQLNTHAELFEDPPEEEEEVAAEGEVKEGEVKEGEVKEGEEAEGEEHEEHMSLFGSLFGLCLVAAIVAWMSEILVQSIEGACADWGIADAFVNTMLVPVAGNAAEHMSAIIFAAKDRLDLGLGICIGSSVQIFAFVLPLCVVVGWIIDMPLTLDLGPFEFGLLFITVLIGSFTLINGSSNWLAGVFHIFAYVVLCVAYLGYAGPCGRDAEQMFDKKIGPYCSHNLTGSSSHRM